MKETGKIIVTKVNKPNEDSQPSQKDVIVRRIKKKGENAKAASQGTIGFGHKKSNSEMIPEDMAKNESFKALKYYQNSVIVNEGPNKADGQKAEFRSQHYKKALDKFQEFKKEQQMLRKNTPITKFRKGSAKKVSIGNPDQIGYRKQC